ncbi:hypothetical protein AAG570_007986 [Ranatra chinensis]|uniref:6-pyruvoyltetrahydropterin synthase n=1 Tax=Ranatra chinensis TaxID=642074 RepID=A0ABD0XW33_9HEMI
MIITFNIFTLLEPYIWVFLHLHVCFSTLLTEEENLTTYGKCNHINGHGHNYTVEVTLKGPVSRTTGMVMNVNDLKRYMTESIMNTLDHKNIDKDVPYFKEKVSTTENVAVYIWKTLVSLMPNPALLYEVKIHETDKNVVTYRGE